MYLGIDLGTSGVKAVLVDDEQRVLGQAVAALEVDRPRPLWSEQDPERWWRATQEAVGLLKRDHAREMAAVRAVGLSGQMHGATLLDEADRVLRPAILWNDGRSGAECRELEAREPESRRITGNLAMPGFTAPKLLWVARHEPDIFARTRKVLLPKDYVRLRMTGDYASDMSDSAGTLWLDVAERRWSDRMLAACGLNRTHMPALYEGSAATGALRRETADAWGIAHQALVAGGAGDNAAGAVGIGAVRPGAGFLSLGTSGVIFVANAAFSPNPADAVHAFCHALPGTWHQMAVMLSAASCLSWLARITGSAEEELLREAASITGMPDELLFLPYLSGERTPHNDPEATGCFVGLRHGTERAHLTLAVLEGVAFAFADGLAALEAGGAAGGALSVIGGGARSPLWGRILANVLQRRLEYHAGGQVGPAFGAARLARLAASGEDPSVVCARPAVTEAIEPDEGEAGRCRARLERFRLLYRNLRLPA